MEEETQEECEVCSSCSDFDCDSCYINKGKLNVIQHRSLKYVRVIMNPCEKVFADIWEEENKRNNILESLLVDHGLQVTQYEASIVATVIQWLGTNCGHSFLQTALQKSGHEFSCLFMESELTSLNYLRRKRAVEFQKVIEWCKRNEDRFKQRRFELEKQTSAETIEELKAQLFSKKGLEDLEFESIPYPEKLSE